MTLQEQLDASIAARAGPDGHKALLDKLRSVYRARIQDELSALLIRTESWRAQVKWLLRFPRIAPRWALTFLGSVENAEEMRHE